MTIDLKTANIIKSNNLKEVGFDYLARNYVEASDAVDDYDVHSEIPEQLAEFEKLCAEQMKAKKAVMDYTVRLWKDFQLGEIESFYKETLAKEEE